MNFFCDLPDVCKTVMVTFMMSPWISRSTRDVIPLFLSVCTLTNTFQMMRERSGTGKPGKA